MPEATMRGSCVCGAVTYRIEPPFLAFQYCYCSRCRKASGAAHAANLFVTTDRFRWEGGEEHVKRYELPSAKYWCNGFCDVCGSALPWQTRTGKAFIVPAGTLDDDPGTKPDRNIYWASRAAWHVTPSDLDTFDEGPPRR